MQYEKLEVKVSGSMDYAAMYLYLIEDSEAIAIRKRPLVIVCPGGGYNHTSDREADIVALQFSAMGYHAAVLRYSVAPAVYPAALLELGKGVRQIREHAEEWHVDTEKIAVCGFSAGGHLAASYCMFWNRDWMAEELNTATEYLRPAAMILGYPVITSGEYAHEGSFRKLLGDDYETGKKEQSLEFQVGEQVPRSFVWHTYEDSAVPVQNSLLLVNELVKHHVPTEFHIFERGHHGLSLANRLTGSPEAGPECAAAAWIPLVHRWMENWILEEG